MKQIVELEDKCPRCDHNLLGLPQGDECPACGFHCDDDTVRVIEQSWFTFRFLLLAGLPIALGTITNLSGELPELYGRVCMVVGFVITILIASRVFLNPGRRNRALLWSAGFLLVELGEEDKYFPWAEISTVQGNTFGGGVTVRDRNGGKLHSIEAEFFGAQRKVREFLAAAEELRTQQQEVHEPGS